MAAAAAEAAEKLRRALEDEAKAQARFEGVAWKDWKKLDVERKAAARRCALDHAKVDAQQATQAAAAKAAAPIVVSFTLPFRRPDVFKELARSDNPLDYPAESFHHTCRVQTGRTFEPHNSSGAGVYDTTRQATSLAPGLIRSVEQRWSLFRNGPFVVEELLEVRSPDTLRWRMHQHDQAGGPGATASSLPIVGETLDPNYVDGARYYHPMGGHSRTPELLVQLENRPFGTLVRLHIGSYGRFEIADSEPESIWSRCVSAVTGAWIGCTRSVALKFAWQHNMLARGYAKQGPTKGQWKPPKP